MQKKKDDFFFCTNTRKSLIFSPLKRNCDNDIVLDMTQSFDKTTVKLGLSIMLFIMSKKKKPYEKDEM